jgi:hypothetical protein
MINKPRVEVCCIYAVLFSFFVNQKINLKEIKQICEE